jgi:hypothetical protein
VKTGEESRSHADEEGSGQSLVSKSSSGAEGGAEWRCASTRDDDDSKRNRPLNSKASVCMHNPASNLAAMQLPNIKVVVLGGASAEPTSLLELCKGRKGVIDFWTTKCVKCPAALGKLNDEAEGADALYIACALSQGMHDCMCRPRPLILHTLSQDGAFLQKSLSSPFFFALSPLPSRVQCESLVTGGVLPHALSLAALSHALSQVMHFLRLSLSRLSLPSREQGKASRAKRASASERAQARGHRREGTGENANARESIGERASVISHLPLLPLVLSPLSLFIAFIIESLTLGALILL